MRKLFSFFALGLSLTAGAQKNITCKKGAVKQNGQQIAEYDGVGGMFKLVKIAVFAPGSKDTLIRVTEESFNAKNPLWPDQYVVYKIELPHASTPYFYIRNGKSPNSRLYERDVMELLFNDTVPVLITGSKLDEAAAEKFKTAYAYDLDKVKTYVKAVEDSIEIVCKQEIIRDIKKPIIFKVASDKSNPYEVGVVYEIYQDDVLLGRLNKKVTPGEFSKAEYTFWKKISPATIGGIDMKHVPVAYCTTGPSTFDIPVTLVVGKKELAVKGTYNSLEQQIASLLVQNKVL